MSKRLDESLVIGVSSDSQQLQNFGFILWHGSRTDSIFIPSAHGALFFHMSFA